MCGGNDQHFSLVALIGCAGNAIDRAKIHTACAYAFNDFATWLHCSDAQTKKKWGAKKGDAISGDKQKNKKG